MKTGRNDPCPCGSGKKWKKCCAAVAVAEPAPAAEPVAEAIAEPIAEPRAETTEQAPSEKGGGRDWVPLQHQQGRLRPSNFGRKRAR